MSANLLRLCALAFGLLAAQFFQLAQADDKLNEPPDAKRREMQWEYRKRIIQSSKLREQGKLVEAIATAQEGLALCREFFPAEKYPRGHSDLALVLDRRGHLLREQGKLEVAERFFREALAMNRKLYPVDEFPEGHLDLAAR